MADSETAASAAPPPTETKPPATESKRWGDIVDDDAEDPTTESGSPSEVNLEGLKIDESKKINRFLDEPEDSNIKAVTSGDTPYTSASNFEDLNLSPELLKGLYVEMKFQKPSKIQAISLPMILTPPYKDLIAQAHNGSGKTTCFVLGMLSRVDPNLKAPQALCICPTRELAIQNMEVLRKMGKYAGITSECAVPMDSRDYMPISKRAPISAQIVIGTPGTIKKWMSAKKLGTSHLKILVFDEADHMLAEDGFKDDSLRIKKDIERSSSHCQVLLFSATFNETVKNFVSKIVKSYNQLFVKKEELSLEAVKQYKVYCHDELMKIQIIKERIFDLGENLGQRIIFVRTRNSASMLHKQLTEDGYTVSSIQGAITPEDRDKLINEFRSGLSQVLISTDLLARGFDQQQVNLVINYDLPIKYETHEPDYEVYLHRIGRAGRFGRKGAVFNLICGDRDAETMRKIELYFQTESIVVKNNDEEFENALRQAGLL
ncbi:DEAD-box ATP-dependent RNA helicase 38 [Morus notabilis]|uniref:RNA helicase n=1 Tax=Morus notabilis TaxID=981085 RepID=W9RIU9_9ROSA|nr:DEAD-box ATP-dependent RNA helicase 38 [Morus notabilis]EXB93970.1 DEAD-box ATP-dependent RNA helicase 38 [Morus notabilis]